jgi:hypothetical protein
VLATPELSWAPVGGDAAPGSHASRFHSGNSDLTADLLDLYAAIRQHGAPEALVSDGGSVFKAKQALRIYEALGIRKEQIDRKQPW